jgi:hypothetical protein
MSDVSIGKIVGSESHVRYTCQVFTPGEVATPPQPVDYAFGNFVRVPLRISPSPVPDVEFSPFQAMSDVTGSRMTSSPTGSHSQSSRTNPPVCWAIGLIYDTILINPTFGNLGPRLSNDTQVELFSPDYLSERAVLVSILLLGTMTAIVSDGGARQVSHGVPPLALDLGAEVSALDDTHVRAFHYFPDGGAPGGSRPYLHMGYLAHALALDHALLPVAMLRTIERLERLFPENSPLLSIVKRNFAWRMKVQTAS